MTTLEPMATREPSFGQLEPVDIRSCWPDEARHFTPWLATPEGLALLSRALGMELALEGTEVAVGPYFADILARDLSSSALVVIENQLEKTNHDHLGKALTYAAVLGANSVVWIARSFTGEHTKVLEWLNELTHGDLALYGVELQVWRIGTSQPAPRLEVVCRPNAVVNASAIAKNENLTDARQCQWEFWKLVRAGLEQSGKFSSFQTPRPQYWYDVALGRSNIFLSLTADTFGKRVALRVYMNWRVADRALAQLLPQKAAIEQELGSPLVWNPFPEKRDKIIMQDRPGDIMNADERAELAQWIVEKAILFKQVFGPRIARLDLQGDAVKEG